MQLAADRRNAAAQNAHRSNVIRVNDWGESHYRRERLPWRELGDLPRYVRLAHEEAGRSGLPWRSRADYDASRERAAAEIGAEAERAFIASVVRAVAEDVTIRHGFTFWRTKYVSVEYEPKNADGPYRWTAHRRDG
jgi:hypothetical protein